MKWAFIALFGWSVIAPAPCAPVACPPTHCCCEAGQEQNCCSISANDTSKSASILPSSVSVNAVTADIGLATGFSLPALSNEKPVLPAIQTVIAIAVQSASSRSPPLI